MYTYKILLFSIHIFLLLFFIFLHLVNIFPFIYLRLSSIIMKLLCVLRKKKSVIVVGIWAYTCVWNFNQKGIFMYFVNYVYCMSMPFPYVSSLFFYYHFSFSRIFLACIFLSPYFLLCVSLIVYLSVELSIHLSI